MITLPPEDSEKKPDSKRTADDALEHLLNLLQPPEPPASLESRVLAQVSEIQRHEARIHKELQEVPSGMLAWLADWDKGRVIKAMAMCGLLVLGFVLGHPPVITAEIQAASSESLSGQELLYTALYEETYSQPLWGMEE
jgi:hypothetical protein